MEKSHRLFLRNLPSNVTRDDIEERFKTHGAITNIDIKEKANAPGGENKFAFVNITTTERKLNSCFQELKNFVINGCKVHMEVAKESFLARLQREREENKVNSLPKAEESRTAPTPNTEQPQLLIKPIRIPLLAKPDIVQKEYQSRPIKKTFDIDFEEVPKPKPKEILETAVAVEQEKIVPLSSEEQRKKNESDEKRLKSLMERKMVFRMKEGLIREALNTVDQKPLGKKIIFSDNIDSLEEYSAENKSHNKKRKHLFDGDDDDGDNTSEHNEFRIRGNMNKKLQSLQSNFGNDKRFALDERFAEDEENDEKNNVDEPSGIHEERDWQLDILQNVLGKPIKVSGTDETLEKRKKMIRYDPMKTDHAECEVPVVTHNQKKTKKVKQLKVQDNPAEDKPPELSKETFYNVSDSLANTLKQDEQFSLLKTFGTEAPSTENPVGETVRSKEGGHLFNFSTKDPFKYDSSDNESHNEDEIAEVQQSELKNNWNESLFFSIDDVRFEDARKFFAKKSGASAEFSTLRRELKQIVKSKIKNNLRKKMAWKKKKVQKT